MTKQEKQKVFDYVRENIPYELKLENSVDYIIDLENGTSIYFDDIDDYLDEYLDISNMVDDWIEYNYLDTVNDYKSILKRFEDYKDYFMYNQACLIDFKDYILKEVLKYVRT